MTKHTETLTAFDILRAMGANSIWCVLARIGDRQLEQLLTTLAQFDSQVPTYQAYHFEVLRSEQLRRCGVSTFLPSIKAVIASGDLYCEEPVRQLQEILLQNANDKPVSDFVTALFVLSWEVEEVASQYKPN